MDLISIERTESISMFSLILNYILAECTYDTTSRENVTIGGHPSMYEMCQAHFWHYPKGPLYCDSTADPNLKNLFGIEDYIA